MTDFFSHVMEHYIEVILAAVLIAALALSWRLIAALAASLFSKITIRGNWETKFDRGSGLEKHEDAEIQQFIHRVWGRTTLASSGMSFRFRGTIVGDRVCLVYRAKYPATDCGAFVLKIKANGKEMKGYEVGIDRDTDEPKTYRYEWLKKL
jgi:hypothetical protein